MLEALGVAPLTNLIAKQGSTNVQLRFLDMFFKKGFVGLSFLFGETKTENWFCGAA